jgi:hypothetical protein
MTELIEGMKIEFSGIKDEFSSAAFIARVRDFCVSLAMVAIIIPIALFLCYSWRPFSWTLAALLLGPVVGGAGLLLLQAILKHVEERKRYEAWIEDGPGMDDLLARAHGKRYALTPHRLQVLAKRGASDDIVKDLQSLAATLSSVTEGPHFIREVAAVLGPARFHDEVENIMATHDISQPLPRNGGDDVK